MPARSRPKGRRCGAAFGYRSETEQQQQRKHDDHEPADPHRPGPEVRERRVLHRTEPSPYVHAPLSKPAQLAQRLKLALSVRTLERQQTPSNPVLHSMNRFNSGLGRWINRSDFDIVNLHWLGAEMLSIDEIVSNTNLIRVIERLERMLLAAGA